MKLNDKVLHFGAGFLIALCVGYLLDPITSFISACVIGFIKEVWDYFGNGTPDFGDFIATCLGGAIGSLILCM